MGLCSNKEVTAEQQRKETAEQQRNLVIGASDPLELHYTSPDLTLQLREAHTVLEVLQIVAEKVGLRVVEGCVRGQ